MAEKAAKKTAGKSSRPPKGAKGTVASASMIADVQQLVQLMIDNGLGELDISEGRRRIHLKRNAQSPPVAAARTAPAPSGLTVPEDRYTPAQGQEAEAAEAGLADITSPMVGTLYAAASPDSDPFVTVGDVVDEDDVVCIIEAMKVMNEIRAECAGTIAEICAKNAQPVEFGQRLFRVKTA